MSGAKLTDVWFMSLLFDWLHTMQAHLDTLITFDMVNATWVELQPCARLKAYNITHPTECVDGNYHLAYQLICSVGDTV
jgi:hypothetical protein